MRHCHRHGPAFGPCSCNLGKLPRLVEPALLYLLSAGAAAHGYDLLEAVNRLGLSDVPVDPGTVYRTLRSLEASGLVVSEWETGSAGPARRVYQLTDAGQGRLSEWGQLLARKGDAIAAFAERCLETTGTTATDGKGDET
jgi:PadR family transcriptional regulator PadR